MTKHDYALQSVAKDVMDIRFTEENAGVLEYITWAFPGLENLAKNHKLHEMTDSLIGKVEAHIGDGHMDIGDFYAILKDPERFLS